MLGFALITQVTATAGLGLLIGAGSITVLGVSPMGVLTTDMVVGSAPPEKAGSAAAMSEASGELGVGLGVAVMGTVATAVYRNEMASSLPAAVPSSVAEASRDTLSSAIAAAQHLPPALRDDLIASARQAFTSGLNVAGGLGAVLLAGLAIITMVLLRHLSPTGQATDHGKAAETGGQNGS